MIIFRGLGILAPIVFVAVYIALYWFCKIFSSPEIDQGWFVYVGAAIAGIATWRTGVAMNRAIYEIRRKHPEQEAYTHSLFFIPMEYWAIPFVIVAMVFGQKNTNKIDMLQAHTEKWELKNKQDFEDGIIEMEKRIENPKIGDYYCLQFKSADSRTNKQTRRSAPFKVTDSNEFQLQLYTPFDNPLISEKFLYSKEEILKAFETPKEQGTYYWINKSELAKGMNRIYKDRKVDLAYVPEFIDVSFVIAALFRIDGPDFKYHTGVWESPSRKSSPKVNLALKNEGLTANIYAVQYKGNRISWGKDGVNDARLLNPNIKREQSPVKMGEYFYLNAAISNAEAERHIEIFCHDSEGRKFRIDVRPNGKDLAIDRIELEGLKK